MPKSRADEAQQHLDDIISPKSCIPDKKILLILQLLIDEAKDDSRIKSIARQAAEPVVFGTTINREVQN